MKYEDIFMIATTLWIIYIVAQDFMPKDCDSPACNCGLGLYLMVFGWLGLILYPYILAKILKTPAYVTILTNFMAMAAFANIGAFMRNK